MPWKHQRTKPVIGIIGGIGAGKSTIARLFAQEGCAVIDSDALAHQVLQTPAVKDQIRQWLGPALFSSDSSVDRKALGHLVFANQALRETLNGIIHPRVGELRAQAMTQLLADPQVKAIIWDSPLLVESGLHRECDAVVYIDATQTIRQARVQKSRGWTPNELAQREKSQIPLDKKANIADYCIDNSGDEVASLSQVRQVLSQLSAGVARD